MASSSLVQRSAPYLFLARGETRFPISADLYLSQCDILSRNDPTFNIPASQSACWAQRDRPTTDLYLSFTNPDWVTALRGDPDRSVCYAHVITQGDRCLIVYFFLFSHTAPYPCCGCCCCKLTSWAHRGDLKFIAVELSRKGGDSCPAASTLGRTVIRPGNGEAGRLSGAWTITRWPSPRWGITACIMTPATTGAIPEPRTTST